ncbi:MAG: hypothetical protein HQL97_01155 [Magnetococcales bacterium]|nr:hypothetical protein [Magnetococcales bacterium]
MPDLNDNLFDDDRCFSPEEIAEEMMLIATSQSIMAMAEMRLPNSGEPFDVISARGLETLRGNTTLNVGL